MGGWEEEGGGERREEGVEEGTEGEGEKRTEQGQMCQTLTLVFFGSG